MLYFQYYVLTFISVGIRTFEYRSNGERKFRTNNGIPFLTNELTETIKKKFRTIKYSHVKFEVRTLRNFERFERFPNF